MNLIPFKYAARYRYTYRAPPTLGRSGKYFVSDGCFVILMHVTVETMPAALDVHHTPAQRGAAVFRHPSSTSATTTTTTPTDFISPSTSARRQHHPSHLPSQSSLQQHHHINVPENDDAAERRQRRRSKVLEMQRQFQSPGTPSDSRRSLSHNQGLNAAQVTDHYANCIKLSTENKINAKNAFGLHLIDYMAELLKEKTGEMTNFQVASCTLDASAKIYAGRVDAIHADTYKMLGGLGHGDRQSKEGEDGLTEAGEAGTNATKKHKKRHSNTIESNLKNINLNKLDLGFEMDPLFHKTSAAFDEGGTFGLLLNHLTCRDDECELLLDSTSLASTVGTQTDETLESARQARLDLSDIKDVYAGVNFEGLQICPQFADFEFTNWNKDGKDDFAGMIEKMGKSDHAFDPNAVPEPLEDPTANQQDSAGMDHYAAGGFSDDDGDYDGGEEGVGSMGEASVFMADGQEAQLVGSSGCRTLSTAGQLCLQLSLQPTEYSYFNMDKLTTWAGPQHWKLKPHSKDSSSLANGDEDKKAKAKKPVFRIDYDKDVDFDKYFSESKAATTLSKATLDKYSKNVTTLPGDLHYNPDSLFKLFLKPNFVADDDDDHEVGGDMSSGPSDFSQTCSQSSYINDSVFDATLLQGDKLVAQPHKVAKIDIQYARTAKKMDVKKLKSLMWQHLTTDKEEDKENIPSENDVLKKTSVAGMQSFSDMYQILPDRLSRTMAKNLSIPIAFVCLLHLANEKSLKIDNNDEDLVITQN
ncbi:condensin complex subunit 2-like isoform X2 [Patiria miniata]|uniref:Condensin complex subunit 2 n=1 Tax=Patiria miniata TaxID=46514 RepID=A0A914B374_PATMI|nr:condensin complex subunit 2-like isoform X2 [Patiria miniata]